MHVAHPQPGGQQRGVIVPLDDDQGVARGVLCRDVPRRLRAAASTADPEPPALADGEERKPPMFTDAGAVTGLDGSRRLADEAGEERRETTFPDKAEAGAVGLVVRRQARPAGHGPHRALVEIPHREDRRFELRTVERVEEVALVLGRIGAPEQPWAVDGALDPRVVAGRDALGAEPARVPDECVELHHPVAQHVGIRGQAVFECAEETQKDVVPVRVGAVHGVQGNAEPIAYPLRIGQILGCRAVAGPVVLLPVLHEHRLYRHARLDQTHQRDGGVDTAGQCDHRRHVVLRLRRRLDGEGGCGAHRGPAVFAPRIPAPPLVSRR